MPVDREQEKDFEEAVKRGHEGKDVRVRWVAFTAFMMMIGVPLVMFILWQTFGRMGGARYSARVRPSVANAQAVKIPFPKPELLSAPGQTLEEVRNYENGILNSYGWVDRNKGVVHLPIDLAMELLVQRGLPVREHGGGIGKSTYQLLQERRLEHGNVDEE